MAFEKYERGSDDDDVPDDPDPLRDGAVHLDVEAAVLAVVVREQPISGSGVRRYFDRRGTPLSPGSVYPHLQDYAEEGVLERRETTKRVMYSVADREAVDRHLTAVAEDALALAELLAAGTAEPETVVTQADAVGKVLADDGVYDGVGHE